MIAFLRGKVITVLPETIIVEVNGVGYQVFVPANIVYQLPSSGEEVLLYTYFHLREDQVQLFGFLEISDKKLFELLLEVSGVGPRIALGILAAITKDSLIQAIMGEKVAILTQLPGIGKKTAQRLILELKDKIAKSGLITGQVLIAPEQQIGNSYDDARAALTGLGYNQREVEPKLQEIVARHNSNLSSDNLVRLVLQELGKK